MTADQLREIPYTVVETHHNHHHHHSSSGKRTAANGGGNLNGSSSNTNNNNGSGSISNSAKVHKSNIAKDRVDRIRG